MVAHAAIPAGVGEMPKLCPEAEELVEAFFRNHELASGGSWRQMEYDLRRMIIAIQVETVRHYAPEKLPDWAKK